MRALLFGLIAAAFSLFSFMLPHPLHAQPTTPDRTNAATAFLSLTFTGEQSPEWEYFAEEQTTAGGSWDEIPGTTTAEVKPLKFQRAVTVGATYSVRMRARSTVDRTIVTSPSNVSSVVIPPPKAAPGSVELKVIVVVTIAAP